MLSWWAPASQTLVLLPAGEGFRFCARSDMKLFFYCPEVKCLLWRRQREKSHNLLCHKVGKLRAWKSAGTSDLHVRPQSCQTPGWCLTPQQAFNLLPHSSLHQNKSPHIGRRISLLYVVLNINLLCYSEGEKQGIWREYNALFPPGESHAQVSWRQFKCNRASKLIFPKIIKRQAIVAAFLNACMPALDPLHSARSGFWRFLGNTLNTEAAFRRPHVHHLLLQSPSVLQTWRNCLVTGRKGPCNLTQLRGNTGVWRSEKIEREGRDGVGNRNGCMFVWLYVSVCSHAGNRNR